MKRIIIFLAAVIFLAGCAEKSACVMKDGACCSKKGCSSSEKGSVCCDKCTCSKGTGVPCECCDTCKNGCKSMKDSVTGMKCAMPDKDTGSGCCKSSAPAETDEK